MPPLYGTRNSPEIIRPLEVFDRVDTDEPAVEPVRKEPFSKGVAFGISSFALFILGLILVPSADLRLLRDIGIAAVKSLIQRFIQ